MDDKSLFLSFLVRWNLLSLYVERCPLLGLIFVDTQDPLDKTTVGIVGGGFAGLYAGLLLQSLGIDCEIFEASERVGGRIDTWYSTNYDAKDKNKAGWHKDVETH